jgi:hypothetical protein
VSSPYAIYGARLVERGFCAVPCMPGDKIPADFISGAWKPMSNWTSKYTANLPSERQVASWANKPDGGVCLILGRASQYVVAIDVDVDEAVEDVRRALPHTDVVKKGQKGATFFFRSKSIPSTAFNGTKFDGRIVRLVDVLAEGRQTVLPPSIHPKTGQPYKWTGKYALDEIEPDDLPELPEDTFERLKDVLRDQGYNDETMPHSHAMNAAARAGDPRFNNFDQTKPYKILNQDAWANVEKWIHTLGLFKLESTRNGYIAVANFRDSSTGNNLEDRSQNLKIDLRSPAIVDFGDNAKGYSPIDLVAVCRKLTTGDAYRFLADLVYGLAHFNYNQFDNITPKTNEAAPPEAPEEPAREPMKMPRIDVTQAPGLLGMMANHITLSARFQQPLFSMGAALAVMSVLTGRQYRGPTGTGTSLYQIIAAPSGFGKQNPMDGVAEILGAAGLIDHLGPGEFSSDVAIFSALLNQPNLVCCIDECAGLIGRGSSRNAATYETGISAEIRKIYSRNFKLYKTKESAARKAEVVHWPNFSIFGATTTGELYAKMSKSEVENGLLNRFIILRNDEEPIDCDPQDDITDVPGEIIVGCKQVYDRESLEGANYHGDGRTPVSADKLDVPFANSEAKDTWKDIEKHGRAKTRSNGLYVRCAENTIRVATLVAISRDWRNPAVTKDDLLWASTYVFGAADTMCEDTEDKISENPFEAEMNKVYGFIKKAGGEVTRMRLMRAVKMPSKRVDEVVNALVEAGRVKQTVTGLNMTNRIYTILT